MCATLPKEAERQALARNRYQGYQRVIPMWIISCAINPGAILSVCLFASAVHVHGEESSPPLGPKRYVTTPAPARLAYVRPVYAPNGQSWPASAGYVAGFKRLHANGLSTVTIDNGRNDSDVYVKLVSVDGPKAAPVRWFYIPAFARFTLKTITAGSYNVRYRDLSSGGLFRSEVFKLKEMPIHGGRQFTNITMTLYKVLNGNMQTYTISEKEFED